MKSEENNRTIFGDKPYQERARKALPLLVEYAKNETSVTYSELAEKLNIPNARNLNHVLGAIGKELESLENKLNIKIPLINTLVINKKDGLPGEGLFEFFDNLGEEDFKQLSNGEQVAKIDEYHSKIFNFSKWDLVLENLGLSNIDNAENEFEKDIKTEEILEGGSYSKMVKIFKRNPKAKLECLIHYGYDCQICGFNFDEYGDIGKNYIQVHHKELLSLKKEEYIIDPINDLIPLCANCHVMVHSKNPPYEIEELKKLMFN